MKLTEEIVKQNTLTDVLFEMSRQGSSVLLNWGEDNNLWECSWITGGKRYTGFSQFPDLAVLDCINCWNKQVDPAAL